jgi:hypothetical protein
LHRGVEVTADHQAADRAAAEAQHRELHSGAPDSPLWSWLWFERRGAVACGAVACVNYAVHADAAEAVVAEIATAGGRAIAVAADVANSAVVEAMVAPAEADLGSIASCLQR